MRKKKVLKLFIIVIVGIVITLSLPTVAKYVKDNIDSYYLRSKNFYYSSNLLDQTNPLYQIGTWSGVGDFSVEFNLYSKENELLFSESDITYTVSATCSTDATCTADITSGTLYANDNDHSTTITVNVHPHRVFVENEFIQITIIAKSTSPYIKELKGRFKYIVGREGVSYEIEDETNRTYLLLKVTNDIDYCKVITAFGNYSVGNNISDSVYRTLTKAQQANCVSQYIDISFSPQTLLLDSTSSVLDSATYTTTTINSINYINSLRFVIAPNSTLSIKFYKIDPSQNYTYPLGQNTSIITLSASDPT